ncbi:MAG: hypothetical protein KDD37_07740 [Bdellovibrionales bacterium]|nr:hypothetical protein [Bdellovibrionales bacterium]
MKSIFIGLMLLSFNVFADGVEMVENESVFTYNSHLAFYACSYAERQAEKYIEQMGGEVVKIRCTGGLPDSRYVSLRLKFVSYKSTNSADAINSEWINVKLRGNESCEFNKKLIEHLLPQFETRNLLAKEFCDVARGRYLYSFDSLSAAN